MSVRRTDAWFECVRAGSGIASLFLLLVLFGQKQPLESPWLRPTTLVGTIFIVLTLRSWVLASEGYGCLEARRDIDTYFSTSIPPRAARAALVRALYRHMLERAPGHGIACRSCWEYYQRQKQPYVGEEEPP